MHDRELITAFLCCVVEGYYCPDSQLPRRCPAGMTSSTGAYSRDRCQCIDRTTFNLNGSCTFLEFCPVVCFFLRSRPRLLCVPELPPDWWRPWAMPGLLLLGGIWAAQTAPCDHTPASNLHNWWKWSPGCETRRRCRSAVWLATTCANDGWLHERGACGFFGKHVDTRAPAQHARLWCADGDLRGSAGRQHCNFYRS